MKLTLTDIKQGFALNNYIYERDIYKLNIFGLRGYSLDGFHPNKQDVFDDTLGVSYLDKYGNEILSYFKVTTDPSTYYFDHLLNPKGVAILVNGQFEESYMIGKHRGLYDALTQRRPVPVWRKKYAEDTNYKKVNHVGMFGINIHKTLDDAEVVGTSSAGCIVFQDEEEFNIFMALCKKHAEWYNNIFTVTLFEEQDFKGLIK